MGETQRRKAANEAVFRAVNERIEGLQRGYAIAESDLLSIVCECARLECVDRVAIAVDAYERVRADATCFVVAPGHEDMTVEDVVDSGGTYLVVRKHAGDPQRIAEQTDPRG